MNVIKCFKCLRWRLPSYDDSIARHVLTSVVVRHSSGVTRNQKPILEKHPKEEEVHFEPFYNMIIRRRDEALKSILIKLDGDNAVQEVVPYLKSLQGVKSTSFYTIDGVRKKYVLVEFSTIMDVNNVLADTTPAFKSLLPAEGRVFEFHYRGSKRSQDSAPVEWKTTQPAPFFQLDDAKKFTKLDEVMDAYLASAEVCDLSTRLHFLTCVQAERIFLGAFPKVRAIPFGSSVNGFGRKGSDLDISLLFNHRLTFSRNKISEQNQSLAVRRAVHDRSLGDVVQVFGNMLRMMLPSCTNVISVPNARIPIVKFRDCDTGLDCDLNVSGPLGICMSEMLYSLASWDQRCRSLLFTVRAWARHHGITTSVSPTSKLTNFSLLLLVIYFLQTKNVLPTLEDMEQLADDRDVIVYEGQPHLFLRHVTPQKLHQWRKNKNNRDKTSQLLIEFFTFYARFPFETKAISITKGQSVNNPTRDAMYIVNPLEETLNVARNVRPQNVEVFQFKCKLAYESIQVTQWQEPLVIWYSLFEMENVISKKNPSANLIYEIFKDNDKRLNEKLQDR